MNHLPPSARRVAMALALSALTGVSTAQHEPPDYRAAIELYLQAGHEMALQQQMRAPYVQPPTVQRFTTPGLREDAWWLHRWLDWAEELPFPPPRRLPPYSCGPPHLPPSCPGCRPDWRCW